MVNELRELLRSNADSGPQEPVDLSDVLKGGRRRVRRRRLTAVGGTALASAAVIGLTTLVWPSPPDLGARLPRGVAVLVFHGLDDETAPPSHADRYGSVIPQAQVYRLPGHDHQLNNDLTRVARAIRGGDGHAADPEQ